MREVDPDISEGMAKIVHRLMRKNRDDRPASPKELIHLLEEHDRARRTKPASAAPSAARRPAGRRRRR